MTTGDRNPKDQQRPVVTHHQALKPENDPNRCQAKHDDSRCDHPQCIFDAGHTTPHKDGRLHEWR